MSNYSALTDGEVNAKLAEKIGFKRSQFAPTMLVDTNKPLVERSLFTWSPCTSRDDLAVVVGHIVDNGDMFSLDEALQRAFLASGENSSYPIALLTCPQRVIAEACLEVLEAE